MEIGTSHLQLQWTTQAIPTVKLAERAQIHGLSVARKERMENHTAPIYMDTC